MPLITRNFICTVTLLELFSMIAKDVYNFIAKVAKNKNNLIIIQALSFVFFS